MDMLCIASDGDPYGHMTIAGRPVTMERLGKIAGTPTQQTTRLVEELREAGVFSETDNGVIYSRRMVRDKAASDAGRETGKGGGNPQLKGVVANSDNHEYTRPINGCGNGEGLTPPDKLEERKKEERGKEPSSLRSDGAHPVKRPKPKSQIKPDWEPDEAGIAYAKDRGIRIDQEVPAFRNRHTAKGEAMADWSAAWRTWCDNHVKWGRASGKPTGPAAPSLFAAAPPTPAPDPWGIRAWIARQPDVGAGTDPQTGGKHPAINGFIVEQSATIVAEAAGLMEQWRGNWDALGDWMRADVLLTPAVLSAISDQARRMRGQGQTIGSIKVFDAAVQTAAERVVA
jgi:hypothetical protein